MSYVFDAGAFLGVGGSRTVELRAPVGLADDLTGDLRLDRDMSNAATSSSELDSPDCSCSSSLHTSRLLRDVRSDSQFPS